MQMHIEIEYLSIYIYIFEIIFERKIEHDTYILCIQNIMT